MIRPRALAALAALALTAGCVADPARTPAVQTPALSASMLGDLSPLVAASPGKVAGTVLGQTAGHPAGTVPPQLARLTPPQENPIDDDPGQILSLDGRRLEALLGVPGFKRDDPPAQVWQYRGAGCILDVFLYSVGLAEVYRVEHYAIRAESVDVMAQRRCFRSLLTGPTES